MMVFFSETLKNYERKYKGRQSMLNQLKGQIVDQCIKTSKKIYNLNMYNWHMFYLACLKLWY